MLSLKLPAGPPDRHPAFQSRSVSTWTPAGCALRPCSCFCAAASALLLIRALSGDTGATEAAPQGGDQPLPANSERTHRISGPPRGLPEPPRNQAAWRGGPAWAETAPRPLTGGRVGLRGVRGALSTWGGRRGGTGHGKRNRGHAANRRTARAAWRAWAASPPKGGYPRRRPAKGLSDHDCTGPRTDAPLFFSAVRMLRKVVARHCAKPGRGSVVVMVVLRGARAPTTPSPPPPSSARVFWATSRCSPIRKRRSRHTHEHGDSGVHRQPAGEARPPRAHPHGPLRHRRRGGRGGRVPLLRRGEANLTGNVLKLDGGMIRAA